MRTLTLLRARLRGTRARPAVAAVTALAVVATFLQANPSPVTAAPRDDRPAVQPDGKAAPARPAPKGLSSRPDKALELSRKPRATSVWPKPGVTEVVVGKAAGAAVGGLAVQAAKAKAKAAVVPARVKVQTFGKDISDRARVDGPVMRVSPGAGATTGTARMSFDYGDFAGGAGADLGGRLELVTLPECALSTPEAIACAPTKLSTVNNSAAKTVTADVPVAVASTLVAMQATEGSAQGTYSATSLAPASKWSVTPSSGSFSWSYPLRVPPVPGGFGPGVSFGYNSQSVDGRTAATNNQGSWIGEGFGYEPGYVERRYKPCQDDGHKEVGDLCWAYDNAVVSLNGSSSELIRVGSTWKMANDDGSKIEKLTGAVNGDANDGTSAGEHWKITTSDGAQYFFGLNRLTGWVAGKEETNSTWTVPVYGDDAANNDDKLPGATKAPKEPCYNATFANASCQQAWRWNLDYAIDRHGNAMAYYYDKETNSYAKGRKTDVNGTAYDRGGWLKRIDYGLRTESLWTSAAPARVTFTPAERCDPEVNAAACAAGNLTAATKDAWPDVPFDRICATGVKCKADQVSPTFFTRKRLAAVTTEIRTGAASWAAVDRWTLGHIYPDNGDGSRGLWLHTIKQDGVYGGGTALPSPEVRLDVKQLPNRIAKPGTDMLGKFVRPRVGVVYNDTGGQIDIEYAAPDCSTGDLPAEGNNTRRCFPVKWHGAGSEAVVTDWFHKYVVRAVRETDVTDVEPGTQLPPDMVTFYDYLGDAAWRYPDPDGMSEAKYKTWSEWRGYQTVRVSKGDDQHIRTRTEHTYLQGMSGDRGAEGGTRTVPKVTDSAGGSYTDEKEFSGFEIETKVLDGTSSRVISKATTSPRLFETGAQTRSFGTDKATFVRAETKRGFTALKSGGWRETKTTTKYDSTFGRTTEVDDLGDVDDTTDDSCARTYYADNDGKNIRSMVSRVETVSVKCATAPNRATQVLSDGRTSYDGLAFGAAPTRGLVTKTERLTGHNGTTATYAKVAETTFDKYGRPLATTDAADTTSRFTYVEANGLTVTKKEHSPKVTVAGRAAEEFVDTTDYDPAWGLPKVQTDWNGKRTETAYDKLGRITSIWLADRDRRITPSLKYTYITDPRKPVVVKTEKAGKNANNPSVEFQLYDGFMRPRQVQTEGPAKSDGTPGRLVADTWYTSTGLVDRISEPYYADGAPSGALLPTLDVDTDRQTRYLYDGADRVTSTLAMSAGKEKWRTTTVYDGDRTHVTPPAGGVATTAITDAGGNVVERWHYQGNTPSGDHDTTKYTYTPAGQLATVTDPDKNVWKYHYDQLGRKTLTEDPDAGKTSYTYDKVDRLISTTDARERRIDTEYDVLGRVTSTFEVKPDASRVQLTKSDYDEKAKGQVFKSTRFVNGQAYVTATMILDDLYRPLETRYIVPADAGENLAGVYMFTSSYNTDGTAQGYTYPASKGMPGEAIVYTYDDLQRVTAINGSDNPYVTDVKYADTGEVKQAQLDAGKRKSWVTLGYETSTMRLQSLMLKRESYTSPENPTPDRPSSDINQTYSYDDAGNVMSISDAPAAGQRDVQCFTYDYLRRMTDAYSTGGASCDDKNVGGVAPYHTSYTYDATGNRLTEKTEGGAERTYAFPDGGAKQPHALDQITEKDPDGNTKLYEYKYDAAGHTTKRIEAGEEQTLDWDAEGHVSSVTNADGKQTSFVYSAGGDRLLRKEPNATTLYLPGMELRMDTATKAVEDTRFIGLAGGAVAVRTAKGIQFQVSDPHGTGQAAVDAETGNLTMRRTTPFGADRGAVAVGWAGEKGFVGGTKDSTTGLTHLGAREYDPATGRFLSVDPIIDVNDPQQMNGYAYSNNSPVTFTDPSGLKFCSDDRCGTGADFVDTSGNYHTVKGDNDGCGGCSHKGKKSKGSSSNSSSGEPKEVRKARDDHERVKKQLVAVAKQLGKILMDELGITDAIDCFTKGDIGGCVNTAVNVISAVIGGAAGKLIARYAFRWKKAQQLIESLWDVGGRLKNLVGDFFKSRKALDNATDAATSCARKNSFVAGTLVKMADGSSKPIEKLKVGDKVLATDPDSGKTRAKKVVATLTQTASKNFVQITVDTDGKKGDAVGTVRATELHPFWVPDAGQWVDAGALTVGQEVYFKGGAEGKIVSIRRWSAVSPVFNLTVDDIHTYYVLAGTTPVLVHNTPVDPYEVGDYDELKRRSTPNDGMDIHHLPQKHPAGQVIPGYDPKTGPAMAVPEGEHRKIPTRRGVYTGTGPDLVADDLDDLATHTNAPPSAMEEMKGHINMKFPTEGLC